MSQIPAPSLPLTGGVVVAGHALGVSWVAAAGIALVLVGFFLVRMAPRPGRRRA